MTAEVWWHCTRCGRSVHNHSSEGVKEINPRSCPAASRSGKHQSCNFVKKPEGT